jgi:hypothetical protein
LRQNLALLNYLIDENQYLYDDMEDILHKQVQRLSKKSASITCHNNGDKAIVANK